MGSRELDQFSLRPPTVVSANSNNGRSRGVGVQEIRPWRDGWSAQAGLVHES